MRKPTQIGIATNSHYRTLILNDIIASAYPEQMRIDLLEELKYTSMFLKNTFKITLRNQVLTLPIIKFHYNLNGNGNGVKLNTFINSILLKAGDILKSLVLGQLGTDAEVNNPLRTYIVILNDILLNKYKVRCRNEYNMSELFEYIINKQSQAEVNKFLDYILNSYSIEDYYKLYLTGNTMHRIIYQHIKNMLKDELLSRVPYTTLGVSLEECSEDKIVTKFEVDDIYHTIYSYLKLEGDQPLLVDYLECIEIECPKQMLPWLSELTFGDGSEIILLGGNAKGVSYTSYLNNIDYLVFLENKNRLHQSRISQEMFNSCVKNANHNNTFFLLVNNESVEDLTKISFASTGGVNTSTQYNNILSELMSNGNIVKCVSSEIPFFLPFKGIENKDYTIFSTLSNDIKWEGVNTKYYLQDDYTDEISSSKFIHALFSNLVNKGCNFSLPVEAICFGQDFSNIDLDSEKNVAQVFYGLNKNTKVSQQGLSLLESQEFVDFKNFDEAWCCIEGIIKSLVQNGQEISNIQSKIKRDKQISLDSSVIDNVLNYSQDLCEQVFNNLLRSVKQSTDEESFKKIISVLTGDISDDILDILEDIIFNKVIDKLNINELSVLSQRDSNILKETLRHNLHGNIKKWLKCLYTNSHKQIPRNPEDCNPYEILVNLFKGLNV